MPVMDEFKEEREALKHGTPKEKFTYFMDYYKWHVIIAAAAIVCIASLVTQILNRRDIVFYAVMINGTELESAQEYKQAFAEYASLDLEENDIMFDTSVRLGTGDTSAYSPDVRASAEKLMVYIASSEVDVFVTEPAVVEQYAYNEFFVDLRTLLTPEQISRYEPWFYYVDQAVVEEHQAALGAMDMDRIINYPDPLDPDSMEEPIPIGIRMEDPSALKEYYYYAGDDIVITVMVNSKRLETASSFIDFLLQ